MGAFVISKRFNDEYKFVFTSRKGKAIFTSNSYELKMDCEQGIEDFKSSIQDYSFPMFKSTNGKYFFKVMIHESKFATSRKFSTELRLQKSIEEIKKYAVVSEILDFSKNEFVFED